MQLWVSNGTHQERACGSTGLRSSVLGSIAAESKSGACTPWIREHRMDLKVGFQQREKNHWESSKFFPLAKNRINVGIISPKKMMTPKHPILFPRNGSMSLHFQDNSSWVPHALMSLRLLVAAVIELTVEEKTTMPRTKTSRKMFFRSPQGFRYPGNFH